MGLFAASFIMKTQRSERGAASYHNWLTQAQRDWTEPIAETGQVFFSKYDIQ